MRDGIITLAEALASVELEPGNTYDCLVNGNRVTVHVTPASRIAFAARFDESDVMLDSWCELPSQGKPIPNVVLRWGKLPVDIPPMPADDE